MSFPGLSGLAQLTQMTRKRRVGDPDTPWSEQIPTAASQPYPSYQDDQPQSEIQNYQPAPESYPSVQPNAPMRLPGSPSVPATVSNPAMDAVPMPELPGTNPYSQFPAGPPPQNPDIPRQPNRTDAIYNDKFSRKRGFVEGLMRGLATGNPIAGVIEGGIGAASKRIGGEMAFNHDFNQYANTRMAQLKIEDADPNLRHSLQMDLLKQQMNNLITRGTALEQVKTDENIKREDNKAGNKATFATEISGPQRLAEIKARVQGQKDVKSLAGEIKASGKLDEATALFSALGFDDTAAQAHAAQYLRGNNAAMYEKLLAQADQASATAGLRTAQTANVGAGGMKGGITPNKSLDVDLKPIDSELRAYDKDEADLKKQRLQMSPTKFASQLAEINKKKAEAHQRRQGVIDQHRQPAAGAKPPAATPKVATAADVDRAAKSFPKLSREQILQKFKDSGYTIQ